MEDVGEEVVGNRVGILVGSKVGLEVGFLVGSFVGSKEGFVGSFVGSKEGFLVGTFVVLVGGKGSTSKIKGVAGSIDALS